MTGARWVTVRLTVGDPTTGEWCERCALPSAVRFPLYGLSPEGVTPLGTFVRCPECYRGGEGV